MSGIVPGRRIGNHCATCVERTTERIDKGSVLCGVIIRFLSRRLGCFHLVSTFIACSALDRLARLKHLGHVHRLTVERERNNRPNGCAIFAERRC